jgi:hypothetical protein
MLAAYAAANGGWLMLMYATLDVDEALGVSRSQASRSRNNSGTVNRGNHWGS